MHKMFKAAINALPASEGVPIEKIEEQYAQDMEAGDVEGEEDEDDALDDEEAEDSFVVGFGGDDDPVF